MKARQPADKPERRMVYHEERQFRLVARRNRMLGLWAAQLLGKTGQAADAYARDLVLADLAEPGDDDVMTKLRTDFVAGGIVITDAEIRVKLCEMEVEAKAQLTE